MLYGSIAFITNCASRPEHVQRTPRRHTRRFFKPVLQSRVLVLPEQPRISKDSMVISNRPTLDYPANKGIWLLWEAHLRDLGGVDHHVFVIFCHFATKSFELGVASVLSQFPCSAHWGLSKPCQRLWEAHLSSLHHTILLLPCLCHCDQH